VPEAYCEYEGNICGQQIRRSIYPLIRALRQATQVPDEDEEFCVVAQKIADSAVRSQWILPYRNMSSRVRSKKARLMSHLRLAA
jgi:hypothetical protein